jgi:hypothetical protein
MSPGLRVRQQLDVCYDVAAGRIDWDEQARVRFTYSGNGRSIGAPPG